MSVHPMFLRSVGGTLVPPLFFLLPSVYEWVISG